MNKMINIVTGFDYDFQEVSTEKDIPSLVDNLLTNIGIMPDITNYGFFNGAIKIMLVAVCDFIYETCPVEDRTYENMTRVLEHIDITDENKGFSELDRFFDELEAENPLSEAVINYKQFKERGFSEAVHDIVLFARATIVPAIESIITTE